MNLKTEWTRMLTLLKSPGVFFDEILENRADRLFRDALQMLGIVLVISTVLYFLFTVLNLSELQQQAQAMRSYGPPSAVPAWVQDSLPWNRFLFPVFWLILIFYGGLLRHLLIRLLGEPNPGLAKTQVVGLYASVPVIVLSIPGFALGTLFPYVPGPGIPASGLSSFAALFSTVLLFGGYAWHGVVAIKALKCLYKQNTGRAFLTWVFAPVGGTLLCCGAWFTFYFVAVLLSGGA